LIAPGFLLRYADRAGVSALAPLRDSRRTDRRVRLKNAPGHNPGRSCQVRIMSTKITHKILSIIIVFLFFLCSERYTAYYPKYEDAVKAGAVEHGWVPEIVPKTATKLYVQHDIDTNDIWLRFSLQNSDINRLRFGVKKLEYNEILKIKVKRPSRVSWWFENLIEQAPANDNALYADIYSVKCQNSKSGYMAIDSINQKVYYWCTTK
jgi:hypothetical protein